MEDFTDEEMEIINKGLEYTDSIRKKMKEKESLCEERISKMIKLHRFQTLFPDVQSPTEEHKQMFLSLDETQQHLYRIIEFELFGGVNYVSKNGKKINKDLELKRVNNILETLFETHKAVWFFLIFIRETGNITKPIKIHFKTKTTKSFLVDLERALNKFRKNNVKDEIERLKNLLDFFPKVDAKIRGEN